MLMGNCRGEMLDANFDPRPRCLTQGQFAAAARTLALDRARREHLRPKRYAAPKDALQVVAPSAA